MQEKMLFTVRKRERFYRKFKNRISLKIINSATLPYNIIIFLKTQVRLCKWISTPIHYFGTRVANF